ncbi:hypothetical protein [Halococcus sediminicola]|uniref:hypothetical protein n=1 Tax=Halococcus sediminicola TaxID=1264579 RepID=UPI00067988E8
MTNEEIDEPIEFPARVLAVVAALATLAFTLIRPEILEDRLNLHHAISLHYIRWFEHCSRGE